MTKSSNVKTSYIIALSPPLTWWDQGFPLCFAPTAVDWFLHNNKQQTNQNTLENHNHSAIISSH